MPKGIPKNGINKGWFNSHRAKKFGFQVGNKMGRKFKKGHSSYVTRKGIDKMQKAHKGKQPKNSKNWKGENHPNWKGGRGLRPIATNKYKKWRAEIFKRDEFTCQICKEIGGRLVAHHIKEWAKYPKLRYSLNNGITLCEDCHRIIHKKV